MTEQKILLIGGVSLVRGRIRDAGLVMKEICDVLEPILLNSGFTDNAPFRTVSLIIRFGEKTDFTPKYDTIDKRQVQAQYVQGQVNRYEYYYWSWLFFLL